MKWKVLYLCLCLGAAAEAQVLPIQQKKIGKPGGGLVVALRSEPKTLNPLVAMDAPSRELIGRMHADLISINRHTQATEPALARSWSVSPDGRQYTLRLRRGIRFSDGQPFDSRDVLFTFRAFLDERTHSPQRDLLVIGGKPIEVRAPDPYTVTVALAQPYAAAERLFDGFPILPRHRLEKAFEEGRLSQAWTLGTPPAQLAGLGPFRLLEYRPGERVVLERNPYYWQVDAAQRRLPYLDRLEFLFVGSEEAAVTRFLAGDLDILDRVGPASYPLLARQQASRGDVLVDAGAGLEYNFLVFNLSASPAGAAPDLTARQSWFHQLVFRRAVSLAVDREAIVRLVYKGRGVPLWGPVTPGNRLWIDSRLAHPPRAIPEARRLLASAGFTWDSQDALRDRAGRRVEFSIITGAANRERVEMATLLQDDLKQLGMDVRIVPLEFRSLVDRVLNTRRFDVALMGLGGGDADPNSDLEVWLSSGGMHLWNPSQKQPATAWEAEIDELMRRQISARSYAERKALYDRVQQLLAEHLPMICLASPDVVVAARHWVGNFAPAVLDHYTLWNAAELFRRDRPPTASR